MRRVCLTVQCLSGRSCRGGDVGRCGCVQLPLFSAAPGGEQPPVCRGVVEVVYRDARWSVVRELNQMVRSLDHIGLHSVNADPLCFDPNLQFPAPQLVDGVQRLMTALQEECNTLLCRVWTKVTARRNGLLSTKLTTERMPFAFTGRDVENFHLSCCGTMLEVPPLSSAHFALRAR